MPEARPNAQYMFDEHKNLEERTAIYNTLILPAIDDDELELGHIPLPISLYPLGEPTISNNPRIEEDDWEMAERIPHFMKFCPNVENLYLLQVL